MIRFRQAYSLYRGLLLVLLSGLVTAGELPAQDNTLYFMHPVPQSIHTNPALYYNCRTYIELPVISSIGYSYSNSGFGYNDAIKQGTGLNADSLLIDMDKLEKTLKKRNYLRNDVSVNLAGAGFSLKDKYYVHFNIGLVTETRAGYPGDLVALKDGNWDVASGTPRNINLSGLGVKGSSYLRFAAGVSTEFMPGLYLGATLKYLKGAANISSPKTKLRIETQGDPISVKAITDYSLRASFPMQIEFDTAGYVSSLDVSNSFSNIINDYILNNNHGFAIDLGAVYEYDDQLTLAASIVDFGLIRWGSDAYRFDANASIDYSGFDMRSYASAGNQTDFLGVIIDSIVNSVQFESRQDAYWSTLSPKIYLGASYMLYPKVQLAALTRTELYDLRPHFALTLSGMYSPFPFLHGTLSYSIMNYKFNHLGLGIAMGGKGGQFYFVTDNIPFRWVRETGSGIIWPFSARTVNFRFGINLIFGCQEKYHGKYGGPKGRSPGRGRRRYCPAYR